MNALHLIDLHRAGVRGTGTVARGYRRGDGRAIPIVLDHVPTAPCSLEYRGSAGKEQDKTRPMVWQAKDEFCQRTYS